MERLPRRALAITGTTMDLRVKGSHPPAHTHPLLQSRRWASAMATEELRARLKGARRVVVKAGTSVVSTPEGYPSLVRLANIVEQVGGGDDDARVGVWRRLGAHMEHPIQVSEGLFFPRIKPHAQICLLIKEGREVLLVTSGAVGIGRQLLSKQQRLSLSVRDVVSGLG